LQLISINTKEISMPKFISVLVLALLMTSCIQDQKEKIDEDPIVHSNETSLENQIAQLRLDLSQKDSMINESLFFFNEIKENLETISSRKDEIRVITSNNEVSNNDKEWILEEIKHINYLRQENANKLNRMKDQLNKNGTEIAQLTAMIDNLNKEILWKDEQINQLQVELHKLDQEYSALFDAYQEESMKVDELVAEINAVYYAFGTEDELKENGVIEKKNGFIGIGKKVNLKTDINDDYFTKINASSTNTITIHGEKIHFITNHPTSSYNTVEKGKTTIIEITNTSDFWKISKYLVVIVK